MKTAILTKLALKNIRTNRVMLIPFILSSSIMLSIFYIMRSLVENDYVVHRHRELPLVMNFGTFIVGIFTFIFIIYANRYLIKRRYKEFSLYAILGLETRHIRGILFVEELLIFFVIGLLSILEGHIFGKLSFLGLNKIMKDMTVTLIKYSFSPQSALLMGVFTFIIFLVVYVISSWSIKAVSPIQLLSKQNEGQREPRSSFMISLGGILLLFGGYYLALVSDGTLNSLKNFFIAVIMVTGATYFLFVSFSIWILKLLKKRDSYYRTKNFLSISGMLYRMKANAMGLASIAVMSTAVIVTVGSTLSIYSGIEGVVDSRISRDYSMSYNDAIPASMSEDRIIKIESSMSNLVRSTVSDKSSIEDIYVKRSSQIPMLKKGDTLNVLLERHKGDKLVGMPVYALVETLESYNKSTGKKVSLKNNEVLMTSNNKGIMDFNKFKIGGKYYKIIKGEDKPSSEFAIDAYYIVVKDYKTMVDINKYYSVSNIKVDTNLEVLWNLAKNTSESVNESSYTKRLEDIASKNNMNILTKAQVRETGYSFNGGFLFIGILIGIMFLVGTVLVTYYKQLTEGYEDRGNYQIMKKVGLPEEMIKKTASSQIIWMLFIPLLVAVVHTTVASKVLSGLLGLFGVWSYGVLVKNLLIVTLVFLVFYLVVFKITSNIYYKIVN